METNDKYEEALAKAKIAKAKKWYGASTSEEYHKIFEDIFPELHDLTETEIIENLYRLLCAEVTIGTFEKYGLTDDAVFSWLKRLDKKARQKQ